MRKLSADAERVLDYLNGMERSKDFEYAKIVAKGAGISASQLSQSATGLERRQLILRRKAGTFVEYSLTEAGKLYVRARPKAAPKPETLKTNPQTQIETLNPVSPNLSEKSKGAHKLMLTIPYQRTITLNELIELAAPYHALDGRGEPIRKHIENQTILVLNYQGITIELTASSLIAYATPRFVSQEAKVQDLHDELVRETLGKVSGIEKEFRDKNPYFKLKMRHALAGGLEYDYVISEEHIAFLNDEAAKDAHANDEKVEVRHPGTGKICSVVEHSKSTGEGTPIPEAEFKGGHTAMLPGGVALDHGNKWDGFIDALQHKGWNPIAERERLNQVIIIATENTKSITEERAWFRHHDEQIVADRKEKEAMTGLINDLREERKPRPGLRGWILRRLL